MVSWHGTFGGKSHLGIGYFVTRRMGYLLTEHQLQEQFSTADKILRRIRHMVSLTTAY